MNEWYTFRYLLKQHARLSISEHFFTLLANFYVKNENFHPARYLVIKLLNEMIGLNLFHVCRAYKFKSSLLE